MIPQSTSERLMGRSAVPRSNTEAGHRILKDAPADGPVFKTFPDFLGAWPYARSCASRHAPRGARQLSANLDVVFQTGDDYELKLNLFTPKNYPKSAARRHDPRRLLD